MASCNGREGPREEPSLPSSLPSRVPRGLSGEQAEDHVASVGEHWTLGACVGVLLSARFLISQAPFLVKPLLPLQQTLGRHTFAGKPGYASSNPESLCGWETLAKSPGFSGFLCPTFGCKVEKERQRNPGSSATAGVEQGELGERAWQWVGNRGRRGEPDSTQTNAERREQRRGGVIPGSGVPRALPC